MAIYRLLAALIGGGIFAGMAHVAIMHAGGYSGDAALLIGCLTAGAALGSLVSGVVWGHGRVLAMLFLIGVVLAETTNLQRTAEHMAATREAATAPIRAANRERIRLAASMGSLQARMANLNDDKRLARAIDAERAASAAVTTNAAKRGCASNCRKLLEAKVSTARAEMLAAQSALDARRKELQGQLVATTATLAALPLPATASPLANWLDLPAHWLDLSYAAGMSLALLVLGIALMHFAGHGAGSAGRNRASLIDTERL